MDGFPVNEWIITLRYNRWMIEIRRIQPDEWFVAKQLSYRVAHAAFSIPRPLDEFIAQEESLNALNDMDDI
jgi:hypothetical protein